MNSIVKPALPSVIERKDVIYPNISESGTTALMALFIPIAIVLMLKNKDKNTLFQNYNQTHFTPLSQSKVKQRFCSNCGNPYEENVSFCKNCGNKVG